MKTQQSAHAAFGLTRPSSGIERDIIIQDALWDTESGANATDAKGAGGNELSCPVLFEVRVRR